MKKIILSILLSLFVSINFSYSATCIDAYNQTEVVLQQNYETAVGNCNHPFASEIEVSECIEGAAFTLSQSQNVNYILWVGCCILWIC